MSGHASVTLSVHGLRPGRGDGKLFPAVILSNEVAAATEESKDPYSTYMSEVA